MAVGRGCPYGVQRVFSQTRKLFNTAWYHEIYMTGEMTADIQAKYICMCQHRSAQYIYIV